MLSFNRISMLFFYDLVFRQSEKLNEALINIYFETWIDKQWSKNKILWLNKDSIESNKWNNYLIWWHPENWQADKKFEKFKSNQNLV